MGLTLKSSTTRIGNAFTRLVEMSAQGTIFLTPLTTPTPGQWWSVTVSIGSSAHSAKASWCGTVGRGRGRRDTAPRFEIMGRITEGA